VTESRDIATPTTWTVDPAELVIEEAPPADTSVVAEKAPAPSDPQADLDALRAELESERARLAERSAALGPLLERAREQRDELDVLRASLVEKEDEIEGVRADLAAARAQIAFERERLAAEIDRVRRETADEREHIVATKERLRAEIERLRRDRVWLDGELQQQAVERRRLEVLSASLDDLHARLQADRAQVISDLARLGAYPVPAPSDEDEPGEQDPDEDGAL
jgi:chromosome segregation ATPase